MIPICAHSTACSRSASLNTISGLLPPVSRVIFFKFTLAIFIICLAVAVLPVNAILSTSMCEASAAPAMAPCPFTILTTPGGKPASTIRLARKRIERGVCSAGLRTTVFPQARAGPSFQAAIARGKFHL